MGYRHNSETGQREFVEDAPAVEQPTPRKPEGPPHGWVGDFLNGPSTAPLFRPATAGPRHRGYRRKSLRR